MKLFLSELQYLSELYERLGRELANGVPDNAGSPATAGAVLQNQELVSRVGQLNGRVSHMAEEWAALRSRLDPALREKITSLAQKVQRQADRLSSLCEGYRCQLQTDIERITRDLNQLSRGQRYLECVKPAKANFPKFVDSRG